jgi:hypothetical protein
MSGSAGDLVVNNCLLKAGSKKSSLLSPVDGKNGLTLITICVICRFWIDVKNKERLYDLCVRCSSVICQDCVADMDSTTYLVCSENCCGAKKGV